jgi:hypothetical protein
LADIWDNKYDVFFKRLASVFSSPDHLFNRLAEFNGLTQLFPTNIRKTKLNDDLREAIFTEFSFKYITKLSASCKIIKEIYNLYFNKFVVNTEYDDSKHVTYTVDEAVYEYYDFAKEYLIIHEGATLHDFAKAVSVEPCEPACDCGVEV